MSKVARIQQAKQNAEANIELMATWPHKKLAERLELVNIQSEIAEQKRDTEALDLLEVWRAQLIEARIHKYENSIPDAVNEIQEAIADIETVVSQEEERKEIIEEVYTTRRRPPPNKSSEEVQLPLF
jgi:uncharacterized protein Yka (UPF0111/DUF47 family)